MRLAWPWYAGESAPGIHGGITWSFVINAIAWQLTQVPAEDEDAVVAAAAKMIGHAIFADATGSPGRRGLSAPRASGPAAMSPSAQER